MKAAIIDIGSNTVRLGIVESISSQEGTVFVCPKGKQLATARLGEGLVDTGRLQEASMKQAIDAIAGFYTKAQELHLPAYAYATSAVRDAANREDFLSRLHKVCPVPVEVLDGETEGRLAYLGAGGQGTLLDIGGGSAQIVTANGSISQPTGCVRGRDLCPEGTPEKIYAALLPWLEEHWGALPPIAPPFLGVGGTITTLGALQAGQTTFDGKNLATINMESLDALLHTLHHQLQQNAPLPLLGKRREVILQGGCILRFFMEKLAIPALTPIDRDGLEGYAAHLFAQGVLAEIKD